MRLIWLAVGGVALVLFVIGAILPLIPGTPFLILAAYAFARSSPRLEAWLLNHRRLGPLIRDWRGGGAIARPAKRAALTAMVATPVITWLLGAGWVVLAVQIVALTCAGLYVATRPEPQDARESDATPEPAAGE
jgi:uncharacterized membrane protein YbaN (DUF454 family)